MDPGSLSVSICIMMAFLLGAATLSSGDNTSCLCPRIPSWKLSEPPEQGCYQIEEHYRYQCVEGYTRKVGTSSLTRCRPDEHGDLHWTTPSLQCIPDPNRPITTPTPPTPPPITTATTTPTSRQTTWNTSVSVSEDRGTHSVEPTTHGKVDSVTQTQGIQKFTVSPINANRSSTTSPGVHKATPTRLQTTVTAGTFSSVSGQRDRMEEHGKINSVTPTVVKNQTTTSTISPSPDNNSNISPPGAHKGEIAQAMGISASLVIICAAIGIIFFLYRRRFKTNIPLPTEEEMRPINCAPAVPEPV
ncbi:interleukin-15 receptor subunit alpha isoform X2 [Acanthochromis polyacanthus]|uniref:interleukin-15 receptor subunit alpha isoform X2 n=1 Tax=Acanthochromis polyacanthus TaxID=80966 RepID=UPI000B8EFB26|nr:interleukin-15 receptor subunit alpha isoform X2 [Acanthochromis polyacanthus]